MSVARRASARRRRRPLRQEERVMQHISNGTETAARISHPLAATEPEPRSMTLLDLVKAVLDDARSEAEVIATVVYLVNSGQVRLCGNFKGARFDLRGLVASQTAA